MIYGNIIALVGIIICLGIPVCLGFYPIIIRYIRKDKN